jgi:hypothetical protein
MSKSVGKFTFKKADRETGLRSVGNPYPSTDIKLGGKVVGHINPPSWRSRDHKWGIVLAIKCDENPGWIWRNLKKRFDSEPEAREFLKSNSLKLIGLGLYQFENY